MGPRRSILLSKMTDSVRSKRERLIAAACEAMYAQGVEKTTLADVAAPCTKLVN